MLMIELGDRVASIGCGQPQGLKDRRRLDPVSTSSASNAHKVIQRP
jgi:hypothetical protein